MVPMTGRTSIMENVKTILMCIDSYEDACMKGVLYHTSLSEGKEFKSLTQMILAIEEIMENTGFPKATTEGRRFNSFKNSTGDFEFSGQESEMTDKERNFEKLRGQAGTFKMKILFRQHASWQGSVSWLEGSKNQPFRSALELIMLMNSALS